MDLWFVTFQEFFLQLTNQLGYCRDSKKYIQQTMGMLSIVGEISPMTVEGFTKQHLNMCWGCFPVVEMASFGKSSPTSR